jgi:ABC-type Fe3+ transport system permease subunit/streptogramin lyase
MIVASLANSLVVGLGTVLVSLGAGVVVALWARTLSRLGQQLVWLASMVTLMLPSFLVTNTWLDLVGAPTSSWGGAPPLLFTTGGVIWLLSLQYWALPALALTASWSAIPRSWLEIEPELRGFRLFRRLLAPTSRDVLLLSGLLVFALSINQVSVPTLLQVKVLAAEVWTRYSTDLDAWAALRAAWPLWVVPLGVVLGCRTRWLGTPSWNGWVACTVWKQQLGRGPVRVLGLGAGLLLAVALGLPILQLVISRRTWAELPSAFAAGFPAMVTSIRYGAIVATIGMLAGLWAFRHRAFSDRPSGFHSDAKDRRDSVVTGALALFFLVPGMLLAIVAIGWAGAVPVLPLYGTSSLAIATLAVHVAVIGWLGAKMALSRVDPGLRDALALMPLSRRDAGLRVVWPQVSSGCATAWYILYLIVLWDVEVMTLLQVPGGETLALRIFNLLHYGHNDQVNALCLQLILAAALPWIVWRLGSGTLRRLSGVSRAGHLGLGRAGELGLLASPFFLSGCTPSSPTSPPLASAPLSSALFERVEILGQRGTAAGQFNKPRSLTVDREDNLYVVDLTARVQKFSPEGRFLLMWQLAQTDLGKPKGMACDHEGNIVVVEPHYQRVNHFTTDGRLVRRWGTAGTNAGQLTLPRSVAVNAQGRLWLTEYTLVDRVQSFRLPEPNWISAFGRPGLGNGEFNRAEGIDLDASGRLYVADSCNHRIQVFSSEGEWLRAYGRAGAGQGELSYPYDVKVDGQGRQFVCEFGNSRIQVFDAADRSLEVVGGYGSAPGQFGNPWSIALDSRGNLYVADSGNHRVQKLIRR